MKNFFSTRHPRSIQTNMMVYFSLFIVLLLTLSTVFLYQRTNKTMTAQASEYADQVVDQVALSVNSYFDYMEDISNMAAAYENINDEYLAAALDSIKEVRQDIDSIYIFDEYMRLVYPDDDSVELRENYVFTNEPWYNKALEFKGESVISPTNVQRFVVGNNNWVVSISQYLEDETLFGSRFLLIQMNYKIINDICSNINLGAKGYVYIIDENGEYIYHPQLQLINSGIKSENIEDIVRADQSSFVTEGKLYNIKIIDSGHRIVGVTFLDELDIRSSGMLNTFILVLLISLLITLFGAARISTSIVKPLKKLEMIVNEVENGNLDITIDVRSMDEIEAFSNSLQSMIITIKELLEQIKTDQEKIRKSELRALQAQINPHFLYNTLESIIWLSDDKQHNKVKEMVSALSKYFRIVLSKGRDMITLREEIEHVRNYLVIQKIRYSNMLDYEIDTDESLLDCLTLKILVQPIVENAIYHGIKNKYGGGKVSVTAYSRDGDIVIKISDTGAGMKPSTLKNIFDGRIKRKNLQGGVGLSNVNDRIKLMYGEKYGLDIQSIRKVGTDVMVLIPKIVQEASAKIGEGSESEEK